MHKLRVNSARFKADFDTLAQIGKTEDGGVDRPALSRPHLEARRWLKERIEDDGFQFRVDGAGNHFAVLVCAYEDAPALLMGSHLDSVTKGGRFDGALGLLAALEVLRIVKENTISLPVNLEAVDFTDEEGTLVGLLGSSALAGSLTAKALAEPRGGRQNLLEGLELAGLNQAGLLNARRESKTMAGYLELHIEQGPRLFDESIDIGVVTGIVGISSQKISFKGEANHAGTTPMEIRRDAAQGASAFTLAVREIVLERFPGCVANVGNMQFSPGAYNIIPGEAAVSLELRAPDDQSFQKLEKELSEQAETIAAKNSLELKIEPLHKHSPVQLDNSIQDKFARAAQRLGLSCRRLHSGAGHDAQSMSAVCPSGMVFIPSRYGISHSPFEFSEWDDCLNGANVLLQTALSYKNESVLGK